MSIIRWSWNAVFSNRSSITTATTTDWRHLQGPSGNKQCAYSCWSCYPRDAISNAVLLAVARCLCLWLCGCHKPKFHRNGWTDRAGFDRAVEADRASTSLCRKEIQVFLNCNYKSTVYWNFVPNSTLTVRQNADRRNVLLTYSSTSVDVRCNEITTVVGRTLSWQWALLATVDVWWTTLVSLSYWVFPCVYNTMRVRHHLSQITLVTYNAGCVKLGGGREGECVSAIPCNALSSTLCAWTRRQNLQ